MREGTWVQIGVCSVDSGQLMMVDPCYVDDGFNYERMCDNYQWDKKDVHINHFDFNGGVVFSNFGGDGSYPVFAKIGKYGMYSEVKVVLDGNVIQRMAEEGLFVEMMNNDT